MSAATAQPMIGAAHAADVRAATHGDGDAYCRLVAHFTPAVAAVTFGILRNRQESEEIAQEVFIQAWRRLSSLQNPESFGPWIRQMARNRALSQRRRQRPSPAPQDLLEAAVCPRPDPAQDAEAAEMQALLDDALETLSEGTREVVILYYREGQQIAQVAELLDLSEDAVKKRLSRARQQLKEGVMARLKAPLQQSAPGLAIALGVASAIGAPGMAGAATGAALTKGATLGQGALKAGTWLGLGAGGLGAALGGGLGSLGVHWGMRAEVRAIRATPEVEAALKGIGRKGVLLVVGVSLLFLALAYGGAPAPWAILPTGILTLGLYALVMVKAARISDAHLIALGQTEPWARDMRVTLRRRRWFGFLLGQACGWGAVAWVIWGLGG